MYKIRETWSNALHRSRFSRKFVEINVSVVCSRGHRNEHGHGGATSFQKLRSENHNDVVATFQKNMAPRSPEMAQRFGTPCSFLVDPMYVCALRIWFIVCSVLHKYVTTISALSPRPNTISPPIHLAPFLLTFMSVLSVICI